MYFKAMTTWFCVRLQYWLEKVVKVVVVVKVVSVV